MKRELERISGAGSVDVDSPRAKRRKETGQAAMPATTSKSNNVASDPTAIKFRQDALSLWSTVKDATNKEGRLLSTEFLRLPSKRQYADYYQQIQNPIALDEIKSRIETGKYSDLDAVRQDLELCFKNAKKYNMKDSPIWKDAKHLHKLVNKEYTRLTGDSPEEAKVADAENDGDAGSGDEGGRKKKTPNLSRMLKSRLQKLVDKTADDGRVVSAEFMELPSKKMWPGYYKVIKKPQCLENIFKKLKRKEYHMSADFSRDVQLVFSNAMEFNSEESQIHEDARTLKSHFHQLMSDLPAPHSLPEYSASTGTSKITLRLPGTGAASTSSTNAAVSTPVKGGSVMLRVPGLPKDTGATTATKAAEPETPTPAPSTTTRSRAAKEEAVTAEVIPIQPTPSTSKSTTSTTTTTTATQLSRTISTTTTSTTPVQTTQPVVTVPAQTYSSHYPNASYQQPTDPSRPTSTTPSTAQHATTTSYTPATILPTYPTYTNAGYTPSTTTPLNPLSNLNNYGYAYGGAGYGVGATGTTPYSTTNGISYTNATYVNSTATTSSTPAPYYATTGTTTTGNTQNTNPNANANVNAVTAPTVTKTPVPLPLRTFKTVLLTTRACERRLELDAREGVKVWSVRLLNKEKGLRISGVKFDVPPRFTINSTSKVETGGGGQEEEGEGDVKMNEDKDHEEEHEDDGEYEAEPSPAKRGAKGKRKGKGKGKVGRPKKVKVAPAPPVAVTPTTTTVPSTNVVLGEEDVTVKINNTVVPLRSPISTTTGADDGSEEEEDGDEEPVAANGKENEHKKRWEWDVDIPLGSSVLEIGEKGGAVWKVYVDRNFLLDGP